MTNEGTQETEITLGRSRRDLRKDMSTLLNRVLRLLPWLSIALVIGPATNLALAQGSSKPAAVPTFEVASVKVNKSNERRINVNTVVPASGRLVITGMSVRSVIQVAYGLQTFQLVNNDSPVLNQSIDIEAKTERPVSSAAQMQQMLQPLIAERFKLAVHREAREMNAFVLTVAAKDGRLGPKMKKSDRSCDSLGTGVTALVIAVPPPSGERPACGYTPSGVGRIVGVGLDVATIIDLLSPVRLPIVDQTGLNDRYDIDVTYTPTPFSAGTLAQRGGTPMPGVDPDGPSLFNAIEEQLGLKLQPKRMPIPVVIIDHIEPLTEN